MSGIRPKQFRLVLPEQKIDLTEAMESALENAALLALLEGGYLSRCQYEQCRKKLGLAYPEERGDFG